MENLLVHDKQIVTPGEVLTTDVQTFRPGRGTIRDKDVIKAVFVGLVQIRARFINVVPLNGYTCQRSVTRSLVKYMKKRPSSGL